jgi:predicted HTH transcriptional regulator
MEEIYLKIDAESINEEGRKKVDKVIDELMKRYPNIRYPNIRNDPNSHEIIKEIEKTIREAIINALIEQYTEVE